jgi:hypothetical protein
MTCLVCDSPLTAGRCENPACALFLAAQPRLIVRLDGPRIVLAIEDDAPNPPTTTGGMIV